MIDAIAPETLVEEVQAELSSRIYDTIYKLLDTYFQEIEDDYIEALTEGMEFHVSHVQHIIATVTDALTMPPHMLARMRFIYSAVSQDEYRSAQIVVCIKWYAMLKQGLKLFA